MFRVPRDRHLESRQVVGLRVTLDTGALLPGALVPGTAGRGQANRAKGPRRAAGERRATTLRDRSHALNGAGPARRRPARRARDRDASRGIYWVEGKRNILINSCFIRSTLALWRLRRLHSSMRCAGAESVRFRLADSAEFVTTGAGTTSSTSEEAVKSCWSVTEELAKCAGVGRTWCITGSGVKIRTE